MAQAPNKFSFKKILLKLSTLLLIVNTAIADKHENLEFMDQMVTFKKKTKSGSCSEQIMYPELFLKDDQPLADKMNSEIDKVIRGHKMCNSRSKNYQFNTTYEIIKASDDVMSIKWTTENNGKAVHIDAISFIVENGEVIKIEQILDPMAKNFMSQMIELSEGVLTKNADYNQFLQKVADRSIQYYMEKNEWRLLYNYPVGSGRHYVPLKIIPKSFLKQES